MNLKTILLSGTLFAAAIGTSFAQGSPFIQQNFETDESGWISIGQSAKVSLTHDAADVKDGKSALKFDYKIKKGEFNLLMLPTPDEKLSKMQSISFWIKTNHNASLVMVLNEKDGGRYNSLFTVSKDKWQHVELSPSDFNLGTNKDDPKDPDNKLDLETVEGMGIADIGQVFAQSDNAEFTKLLHVQTGDFTLFLDDLLVSDTKSPASSSLDKSGYHVDSFIHPQLSWLAFGEATISHSMDKPLTGAALQADYRQSPGTIAGISRFLQGRMLAGKTQLHFDAASAKATSIRIQLEEAGGGKYYLNVNLAGSSEKKSITINFADFVPADDSKDDNGKLDLDEVNQMMFIDYTGLTGAVDQENTLWINNIRASITE